MLQTKSKSSSRAAAPSMNGSGNRRREFIYVCERIKAIREERNRLLDEREQLRDTSSDEERRRSIYVTEHLRHLAAENERQIEARAELARELKLQ